VGVEVHNPAFRYSFVLIDPPLRQAINPGCGWREHLHGKQKRQQLTPGTRATTCNGRKRRDVRLQHAARRELNIRGRSHRVPYPGLTEVPAENNEELSDDSLMGK
jgi:hypothetical protein